MRSLYDLGRVNVSQGVTVVHGMKYFEQDFEAYNRHTNHIDLQKIKITKEN